MGCVQRRGFVVDAREMEKTARQEMEAPTIAFGSEEFADGLGGCALYPAVAATIIGGMGAGPVIYGLCSALTVVLG
jgi:hypothetical protein